MFTIAQALRWGEQELAQQAHPQLEASILLAYLLGCERTWLFTWPEKTVSSAHMEQYRVMIARKKAGEPIAYITGTKEFWSRDFVVTKDTLIPRPETEELIQIVLDRVPQVPLTLVDIGTGSGVIACTLSLACPQWQVWATDRSWEALQVAKKNAHNTGAAQVQFMQGDLLQAFGDNTVDVIVSNPPYIAAEDPHLQARELTFEPLGALVSGKTGFECYEKILSQAKTVLKPGGLIVLEHGFLQQNTLIIAMKNRGFGNIQGFVDIAGLPRVVIGYRYDV